jgi:FkbM family methyltransferase
MALEDALGRPYRATADGVAALVTRVPAAQAPLVGLSRALWHTPGAGRFARSVAHRLADRWRASSGRYREVVVGGVRLRADITHWMFLGPYFGRAEYEPATVRAVRALLGPGGVFVDVGANCGYFSLVAAALVGSSGRVFAFEPNPTVFRELTVHVELNACADRARAYQCALSDAPAERVRLFVSPRHSGFSTLAPDRSPGRDHLSAESVVDVRTSTFDRWRLEAGVEAVDLVKIDVEGAEDQVLAGMAGSLHEGRVGAIICETRWDGTAHRRLLDVGFQPEALEIVGPGTANILYVCDASIPRRSRTPP